MYKHPNGRLQLRNSGGQFRQATLADLGLGGVICPDCQAINPYPLYTFQRSNGFTFRQLAPVPLYCVSCGMDFETGETPRSAFNTLILLG